MGRDQDRRDESDRPRRRRRHRWVWPVALGLLVLIGLAVGGLWFWNASAARGLDAAIAELRRAGEPVTVADLATPPVPADRNAAPDLRAAARLIDVKADDWKVTTFATPLPLTDDERSQWRRVTEANREALDRVRAVSAAGKDGFDWGVALRSPMIQTAVPEYTQQRNLAILLHGAALLAHEEGNDREAVARAREVLFVGRAEDHVTPTLVSHLVSLGIRALGSDAAVQIATDLNVEGATGGSGADGPSATRAQVKALIADLLDDDEPRDGMRRALRGERVSFLDAIDAILQGRLAGGPAAFGTGAPPGGSKIGLYFARPMFRRNAEVLARHVTTLLGALDAPDLPAFRQRTAAESDAVATRTRGQFLVAIFAPSLQSAIGQEYRCRAERRMAAVALAVRLYALDHGGQLPATLDELVPTYLPAVPRDPLAAGGKPLGYVPDADRPRVYNVGKNGVDDGGNDPDPGLSRAEWTRVADDVRYLKRQPRPAQAADEK